MFVYKKMQEKMDLHKKPEAITNERRHSVVMGFKADETAI